MSNPFEVSNYSDNPAGGQRTLRLRRIGVMSVGMFGAAAGAIGGMIAGAMFFLISLVGVGAAGGQNAGIPMVGGVAALVMVPLMYGIFGFIGGIVNAVIYNVVAGMSGGIEMEFSQENM